MINFNEELENILHNDPLGLLEVKPKTSSSVTTDERLIASFEEINTFFQKHSREPKESRDIGERRLYSRLKGLRENPEKAVTLLQFDTYNLLGDIVIPEPKKIETINDVLNDDVLGLLGDNVSAEADIFALKNIPKTLNMPEHIAKRKPCKEFEQFEPMFKQVHAELISKQKVMQKFEGERQIKPGEFFLSQGMLVYVANIGEWEKRNFGNFNARLLCIFENGTESNMFLRSLAAALWKDENSRHIVDASQLELLEDSEQVTADDQETGYIYVIRSLSEDPQIRSIKNLYKIGFSTHSVDIRTLNAKKEPTYLMADVMPVSEFKTYNLNPQKLELLLHTFFASACLNIDVYDLSGKRYSPREWFVAPLHVIETAVKLLINGDIVNYRYDSKQQQIVEK